MVHCSQCLRNCEECRCSILRVIYRLFKQIVAVSLLAAHYVSANTINLTGTHLSTPSPSRQRKQLCFFVFHRVSRGEVEIRSNLYTSSPARTKTKTRGKCSPRYGSRVFNSIPLESYPPVSVADHLFHVMLGMVYAPSSMALLSLKLVPLIE